ncbi:ATP-dependent DNA helicase PIF1-like [Rhinoderma darwinii]|uniref:ATP-dependent DNA helicase PIF1-like n=1 Tax=Rhinoderma darwinii TaxID=43563 RepID=UPI003F6728C4
MSALETYLATNEPLLVDDQTTAYNQILDMVVKNTGGIVFLDAPGGTGKTKGTGVANVLLECLMIVWDEYTMAHKLALEALDQTLQDLHGNNTVMGGVVLVLAADFRQTMPIVPKGTPADEFKACLKQSVLWRHVKKMSLTTNMRVYLHVDATAEIMNYEWLCQRAILAPKNDSVNAINQQIQMTLPGQEKLYKSTDTVIAPDQAVYYSTEFLNSLEPPGLPAHRLMLKVGSPIMLLRNINAPKLCNGTRLCVKKLMDHVIEATILTGCAKGEVVFIPRIPLAPNDVPFKFKRQQFPVRLAFAMTNNKAQGQSLIVAGIHLQSPCFSHGQLYVACSRVSTGKNLYILAPDQKPKNVGIET